MRLANDLNEAVGSWEVPVSSCNYVAVIDVDHGGTKNQIFGLQCSWDFICRPSESLVSCLSNPIDTLNGRTLQGGCTLHIC